MRKPLVLATHFFATAAIVILGAAQAFAQGTANPYGLDPYKPSDAFWLRNFGGVLVGETPLLELTKLDPYKPSDAALIRQIGNAMPVCCPEWYGPGLAPHGPQIRRMLDASKQAAAAPGRDGSNIVVMFVPPPPAAAGGVAAPPAAPPQMKSAALPVGNDGVWLSFNGERWVSAGRAVPLQSLQADRIGDYGGGPVYRARGTDDVIYLPSRDGLVAPFRRKQ